MTPTIIIGYRDLGDEYRSHALHHVNQHLNRYDVIHADSMGPVFSRAGAFNAGAAEATGDVLVLHNPDVVVSHHQLDMAVSEAFSLGVTVYPFTRYCELTAAATRRYLAGSDPLDYQLVMGVECVGPVLAIRRDVYEEWGGMDERFEGWGFEDVAWDVVSRTLLGEATRIAGRCLHLWHPPAEHSSTLPTVLTEQNSFLCQRYRRADGDRAAVLALLTERDTQRCS